MATDEPAVWRLDTAADDADGGHAFDYDVIVIGGGSGGVACAKEFGLNGARVAMFDYVEPTVHGSKWGVGGTCVNVGCIPKKLCHRAALCGEAIDDSRSFGWQVPEEADAPKHRWATLIGNVQAHVKSINSGYRRIDLPKHNVQYINEMAAFVDPHTVEGTNSKGAKKRYTARRFVLAVGGRPVYPEIPGAELAITSDDIFSLKRAPGKTLVIGASYVALECAGFLHGVGYDTTVMVRSILLRGFDQQMANLAGDYMVKVGVKFQRDSTPTSIEKTENGQLLVKSTAVPEGELYDTVLFAIGRRPETHKLNLAAAGFDQAKVDAAKGKLHTLIGERVRDGPEHIYAIGDIRYGQLELTPLAIAQGHRLAHRLLGKSNRLVDYNQVPTTVFTPLEYGFVGESEEEAIARLGDENVEVWHTHFTPLEWAVPHFASSMVDEEEDQRRPENVCYMKLVCDKSANNKVVGFHVLSDNAGEITQGMALAIKLGATKEQYDDMIGIHPTDAEQMTKLKITKRSGASPLQTTC